MCHQEPYIAIKIIISSKVSKNLEGSSVFLLIIFQFSAFGSFLNLGAALGAFCSGQLAITLGRRRVITYNFELFLKSYIMHLLIFVILVF